MLKTFIDRPVLSTVISIIIVFLGIIGLFSLPVEQYPNVAPPTVNVSANYPGASASVVLNSILVPLEEKINGVEGMTYMQSTASNGSASINIFFDQNVDPDIAAVNVQNRVSAATSLLPSEVIQQGVIVQKQQSGMILAFLLASDRKELGADFIQNYANINIIPQLQRVNGVGSAQVMGAKDYSMRIWIKPDVMGTYGITPTEVLAALNDQNIEAAPGSIGQNSSQSFEYTLRYKGKYSEPSEFEDIIVASKDGYILKLKDVADIELGALNYTINTYLNGKNVAVFCMISQTAGSNADQVIKDAKIVLDEVEKIMPEGMSINYIIDSSEFLDASINKVVHTIIEAFILVFIVVLIFLQSLRSTIIPAIAIPVSLIGAFFVMNILGFSINMITLFALVLAIGIVVDDAIIVVEAVESQLEAGTKSAKEASLIAMKEIAPAIIAITLVMAAVFIPVSFMGGTTGIFFRQFGLTLASAILISAINALTLSPTLCAVFLKPINHNKKKKGVVNKLANGFNIGFSALIHGYEKTLKFLGKGKRWIITVGIILLSIFVYVILQMKIPGDFVPNEDSGVIFCFISAAPGSTLERTAEIPEEIMKTVDAVDGVKLTAVMQGYNFMAGPGSSYASVIVKLVPWGDRKMTADQYVALLKEKTAYIQDANLFFTVSPTLPGFGLAAGVSLQLQDRYGGGTEKFYDVTKNLVSELQKRKEVMMAITNFNPDFPQFEITADIPKIKAANLTLTQIMSTLQAYIGSYYAGTFNLYGKQFRIMVQSSPEYRKDIESLSNIQVKNSLGQMAPITEFINLKKLSAAETLSRFNLFNSMDVMIIPNIIEGYNTGDIYKLMDEIQYEYLGTDYTYEYSGMAREGAKSNSQTVMIFAIVLIFTYLLLCALYESYILPWAIILSLPAGMAGVFIFLLLFGIPQGIVNNIYVQIAMIMLIGLLAKNAILIVEYAIQRRKQGMGIVESAVKGAVARLRPILMTALAFCVGVLPLVFAHGAGAVGNRSLGIATIGGMLIGTFVGVIIIPSLYIMFQVIDEKFFGTTVQTNLEATQSNTVEKVNK